MIPSPWKFYQIHLNASISLRYPFICSDGIGVVYYEKTKRDLNRILTYECRCDERLRVKGCERSTRLGYTGWCGGLEHLKIETSLIDERFECHGDV
jgi:hypothetical protein